LAIQLAHEDQSKALSNPWTNKIMMLCKRFETATWPGERKSWRNKAGRYLEQMKVMDLSEDVKRAMQVLTESGILGELDEVPISKPVTILKTENDQYANEFKYRMLWGRTW